MAKENGFLYTKISGSTQKELCVVVMSVKEKELTKKGVCFLGFESELENPPYKTR